MCLTLSKTISNMLATQMIDTQLNQVTDTQAIKMIDKTNHQVTIREVVSQTTNTTTSHHKTQPQPRILSSGIHLLPNHSKKTQCIISVLNQHTNNLRRGSNHPVLMLVVQITTLIEQREGKKVLVLLQIVPQLTITRENMTSLGYSQSQKPKKRLKLSWSQDIHLMGLDLTQSSSRCWRETCLI